MDMGMKYIVNVFCFIFVVLVIIDPCRAVENNVPVENVTTFGDSITAGYGATPYSVFLQDLINSTQAHALVINRGLGGETTVGGVNRIDGVLKGTMPRYILIMEGANDVNSGVSPATTKFNLSVMIDKSRANGSIPILSTITPKTPEGAHLNIPNEYNPGILSLGSEKGVRVVDAYANMAGDWDQLTWDGMHPNVAGQQRLANLFFSALPYSGASSPGSGGGGGGGGGGGCFLATAAFGTPLAPQVVFLKKFRDAFLLTNEPGSIFVRLYYHYSPPIAHYIARHDLLRAGMRLLLYPLIGFAHFTFLVGGIPVSFFCILLFVLPTLYLCIFRQKQ